MKGLKNDLVVALKGFFMGSANVVPGVSGGTIALITGIYKRVVDSINSVMEPETWKALLSGRFKDFWKAVDGRFLLSLAVGIVVSILSLAKLMTYVLENNPIETWAFFFGLIIASSIIMFKEIKGWGLKEVLFAICGVVLGVVICTLSPTNTPDTWWFLFICGAISICTMILPGISGSFVLVILSKYDFVMEAIATLDIPSLAIFAAGCLVGILAFSKFLHWMLGRYEKQTMLVLLGFVIGSLVKVWPWANLESTGMEFTGTFPHLGGAIIWCILGAALVLGVEFFGKKIDSNDTK